MNKKVATLNVPAIWRPIPTNLISVRKYKSFPYEQDGQIKYASPEHPVTRYAHNFTKGKLKYSLCLFTDEQNKDSVSKYFKSLASRLTESQISMALITSTNTSFMYLEKESYGGDK